MYQNVDHVMISQLTRFKYILADFMMILACLAKGHQAWRPLAHAGI